MRWKLENPNNQDTKIERKFALFPIRIDEEVRWLEFVTIKYRFYNRYYYRELGLYEKDVWIKESFVD